MGVLKIPFYKPVITLKDVIEALKKDEDVNFQKKFERTLDTKFNRLFALNSGTSAFYLFLKLFTKKGDEIILPSILCPVMLTPILKLQRKPRIVDVDLETFSMNTEDLEEKITESTKLIVPVHTYGQPCDIKEIMKIAKERNILVLEDCAHALGAEYKGKKVGTFGHASFFSFNWTKIITTGGGGVLLLKDVSNASKYYFKSIKSISTNCMKGIKLLIASCMFSNRIWNYAYTLFRVAQKKVPEKFYITSQNSDPLSYSKHFLNQDVVIELLDKFSVKVACVGLRKLNWYNMRRREIAKIYTDILEKESNVKPPAVLSNRKHIFYVYTILIKKRDKIREELLKRGVETAIVWPIPLHKIIGGKCPISSYLTSRMLSLPIYPFLSDEDAKYIAQQVIKATKS